MRTILLLFILVYLSCIERNQGYKSAEIPLYRKDTPYCMHSFKERGDYRVKEIWSKVTKQDKRKNLPSSMYEHILKNDDRDDYIKAATIAGHYYCPPWFNMTAIQIDLGSLKRIAGIVVLGDHKFNEPFAQETNALPADLWGRYVSHYTVEFSPDGRIWNEIMDQKHGKPRHFKVTQHYEYKALAIYREKGLPRAHLQTIDPNLHARVIRLNFKAYVRSACAPLVDVYGCESEIAKENIQRVEEPTAKLHEDQCSYMNPLGMENKEIKDHQIEASSYQKSQVYGNYYPHHARWTQGHNEHLIWCADTSAQSDDLNPWIRVRLSSWTKYITFIQHKVNKIGYNMNIELSMDGIKWRPYRTKNKLMWTRPYDKRGTASNHWLVPPEPARYVRFRFTRTSSSTYKACLKFEIYGCSAETQSIAYGRKRSRRVPAVGKFSPTRKDREPSSLILEGDPYQAWCAAYHSSPFFHFGDPNVKESRSLNSARLDLTKIFAISRVIVQGDRDQYTGCGGFPSSISILHSNDENVWVLTRDYNGKEDFKFRTRMLYGVGTDCGYGAIDINPTIYGRYIRFIIQHYVRWPCLRVVLVGYEPDIQPLLSKKTRVLTPACNTPLGMENGIIKDKQITGSSFLKGGTRTEPIHGRLKQDGGWCVAKMKHFNYYYALNDSLEIDLKKEYVIDGFATQGYSNAKQKRWVTGYLVHYSLDGISWAVITMKEQEKIFLGNTDINGIVRHQLNPRIRARKIRFVPVTWNNWVCMRVEIYGCKDGISTDARVQEKLRDIEGIKMALVSLSPDKTVSFDCGDHETWGHTNYLKVNLDTAKTTWYQKAYNKDFPLAEKQLKLATNQFPNDFGSRHFMCIGRTADGIELFWQHLIVVPTGPRHPDWISPRTDMVNMDSADIPQIIAIQRFDPSYDGGSPIWSEPATIYASGHIGQISVYVIGIPYYPMTIHNCLIENRLLDWHYTNLGTVPVNDYRACARLALSRGYDYMTILGETNCLSSWYLPLATSPHRPRYKGECRLEPKVYFINATFEEYHITWSKKDPTVDNRWLEITSYAIRPKMKTGPHVALFADHPDEYREKMKRISDGGRYQTYDKPLFGDTYTGSHVMEIMDMTIDDLGSYKFEVRVPSRNVKNEAIIELRHSREPQIELSAHYQACENVPGSLTVKEVNRDPLDPETWSAKWYHTIFKGLKAIARYSSTTLYEYNTTGIWNEIFEWTNPHPFLNGEYFEVFVENRYGFTTGLSEIEVSKKEETPAIEWISPSPFEAVDGLNQILEVKINNHQQLESIKWFHNGKPIEAATDRYGFPESSAGIHKKLKLIKIDEQTTGKYVVVVQGRACRFEKNIDVKVIVIPRVYFKPQEDYIIAYVTDKEIVLNATVKGGMPKPKLQHMTWTKDTKPLTSVYAGRLAILTTLDEQFNWLSILKLRQLRTQDSGEYTFKVISGPAVTKKSWRVSIRSIISEVSIVNQTIPTTPPQATTGIKINNNLFLLTLCAIISSYIAVILK